MALIAIVAQRSKDLWSAFLARSLGEIAQAGTLTHGSHIWLTHRLQRDHLLEEAARRGSKGWLNPPIHFLSSLPELFQIRSRPIGLLARRHLLARLAAHHAAQHGLALYASDAAVVRGHMLDALFGELLPEGVGADTLALGLAAAASDDFGVRRNAWIVSVYRDYLSALERSGTYDARQIHALVAARIDAGALRAALDGAERLHIFGLHSTRARRRLLRAFADLGSIDVSIYTTGALEEWQTLDVPVDAIGSQAGPPTVQPAPDSRSELQWVAGRVKQLLQSGDAEPHEIAVVARTGLEDTGRALRALEAAGIPATARVRTPLSEIAALKAVLDLFRAAAESWSYRALRTVLASPYLGVRMDLRPFDRIASDARPASLAEWQQQLEQLCEAVNAGRDPDAKKMGIRADGLAGVLQQFGALRVPFQRLDSAKPLSDWIALLKELLAGRRFRLLLCRPQHDRYDVVRQDQRGVRRVELLLGEWSQLDENKEALSPRAWLRMLRTLLDGQELTLTTPGQKGVQILEAHDAVSASFKATFLVHANDGEFPRVPSTLALFTDEERSALAGQGLPLDHRTIVLQRERALWQAVLGGADHVCVSYRTTDPRGIPLLPSLLVPAHDRKKSELPRSREIIGEPLNADQERRLATINLEQAMIRGEPARAEFADPAGLRHALLVAYAEQLRGAPERRTVERALNAWNGEVRDPAVQQRLAERFGPAFAWSPSMLQEYATCPFFFLLNRVLGVREIEEADEETSVLTFGGIAHDVLQVFYDAVKEDLPGEHSAQSRTRLERAAQQVFAQREEQREWLGSPVLWQQRKQNIVDVLHDYLAWELAYLAEKRERPVQCEYVLGGAERCVALIGQDVQGRRIEMRVAGRIDRIDVNALGQHLVLDYKTSNIPVARGYADGVTLQAPVYLEALRESGLVVSRGRYRALKSPGKPQNGAEVKLDDAKYRAALAIAFSIPERVRMGRFEILLAASAAWQSYHPDASICRTRAQLAEGSRFDD
jgi:hypothetical protein